MTAVRYGRSLTEPSVNAMINAYIKVLRNKRFVFYFIVESI